MDLPGQTCKGLLALLLATLFLPADPPSPTAAVPSPTSYSHSSKWHNTTHHMVMAVVKADDAAASPSQSRTAFYKLFPGRKLYCRAAAGWPSQQCQSDQDCDANFCCTLYLTSSPMVPPLVSLTIRHQQCCALLTHTTGCNSSIAELHSCACAYACSACVAE